MLRMDYPSTRGGGLIYYAKKATCYILFAYIDANSQRLTNEYPGDGVQAISRLQSQFSDMIFYDKSRYNRLFQQVIHKGGVLEINYIKIFHNDEALAISVGNIYSEY